MIWVTNQKDPDEAFVPVSKLDEALTISAAEYFGEPVDQVTLRMIHDYMNRS